MSKSKLPDQRAHLRSTPASVPAFVVMDMIREANRLEAAGRPIVHLEWGQPSTPAPQAVRAAAARALATDVLGYTEALGVPALRARIAAWYRERHGLDIDPARVAVTTGSSAGLMLAFLAAAGRGGRISIGRPGYPCYRNIALALGMEPVEIPTPSENGFMLTPAALDGLNAPLDILLVGSPANPTGVVTPRDALRALAGWSREAGATLVVDEVYHGVTYGEPATTALAVADDAIVLNGFSKYFSMTGWRLGWMVVPESRIRAVECLAQNLYIAAPSLSQHAALAAFDSTAELDANVARYAVNRALLLEALPRLGFSVPAAPGGAFYIYARLPEDWPDSVALANRLLAEIDLAVTPGVDFDPVDGHRYVRFGYAGATQDIVEGIRRLDGWRPG
jgi:aspartate/methionine/tyrosine aminotransferase